MSNMICYENLIADIYTPDRIVRFNYVFCCPPTRLAPKGTVVLLHDFFKSSYQFRHAVDLFALAGYITVAPDFPGKTISKKSLSSTKTSMRTLASELSQFLQLIVIRHPVHLVGVGFGAHIAAELAIQHSESVASITCCCDSHFAGDIRRLEHLLRLPASTSGTQLHSALRQFFTRAEGSTTPLSEDDLAEYIAPFAHPGRLLELQQASKAALKNSHTLHDSLTDLADMHVRCLFLQPPERGIFIKANQPTSETSADGFLTTKHVPCDPEMQSESFAVAALGYFHALSAREDGKKAHICHL